MPDTIFLKLDITKIPRDWLFKGAKGTYADIAVYENEQPDEYGNTHAVKMNPPKAVRERDPNIKGVYIGNGKRKEQSGGGYGSGRGGQSQARPASGQRQQGGPQQTQQREEPDCGSMSDDDIPF
jgi:hypothetical protein